jgi:hypothetical protein
MLMVDDGRTRDGGGTGWESAALAGGDYFFSLHA